MLEELWKILLKFFWIGFQKEMNTS
jgi:hypothetical protein